MLRRRERLLFLLNKRQRRATAADRRRSRVWGGPDVPFGTVWGQRHQQLAPVYTEALLAISVTPQYSRFIFSCFCL